MTQGQLKEKMYHFILETIISSEGTSFVSMLTIHSMVALVLSEA